MVKQRSDVVCKAGIILCGDAAETDGTVSLLRTCSVNEDLKMGKGKIAAQCAHAAVGVLMDLVEEGQDRLIRRYNSCGQPKVALKAQDLPQVRNCGGHSCTDAVATGGWRRRQAPCHARCRS